MTVPGTGTTILTHLFQFHNDNYKKIIGLIIIKNILYYNPKDLQTRESFIFIYVEERTT